MKPPKQTGHPYFVRPVAFAWIPGSLRAPG